jgi:ABC-type multidrug transport system permease subunit
VKAFLAVLHARNLEFIRDRSALSWTLLFPIMLVIGFAIIFAEEDPVNYKIGVFGSMQTLDATAPLFTNTHQLQFIPVDDLTTALDKVRRHQFDMLIDINEPEKYWINSSSPNGYILERVLWGTGGDRFHKETVDGEEVGYVDWVLPGILAMNIMFSCLFGVGYVIVRYRKNGFLKRLRATPLSAFQFLLAQLVSRLIIIQTVTVIVFVGADLFIDFQMLGSYLLLFIVFMLGSICMISMGLLVAARIASEELAGGLLNLFTWPMMLLSGVWFSLEGSPHWVQLAAKALPLTHLVDAARAVMTEGAGFTAIAPHLAVLLIMALIFLSIGAAIFKWK